MLLDILPCKSGTGTGLLRQLEFPLDAQVDAGLRSGGHDAARWLRLALARVESRLTGLNAGTDAGEVPAWAVVAGEFPGQLPALSQWRLAEGRLEVAFRAPLTEAAIDILADGVKRILAAIAGGEEPPESFDPLDPGARARALAAGCNADHSARRYRSVLQRFSEMRDAAPTAPAVGDGGHTLSYAELDARADALAQRLRVAGIAQGAVVAVLMERSTNAVVALLGALKAGAAYLPLDPAHPGERLAHAIGDAGVRVALVDAAGAKAPLPAGVERIVLDDVPVAAGLEAPDVEPRTDRDATAYVMYTSGSTGQPKGVQIAHRGILRLVVDADYIQLGPDTRFLHAAPLGFDASTLEIWGALLNGGCVVVHAETLPTGGGLAATIRRQGVTHAWLTAALFNAVVDDDPRHLSGLRELFIGGEALSVDHVRRALRALAGLRLCNGYGPTECTTFAATHAIAAPLPDDATAIPIGRPLPDTTLYVLNARGEPVPQGVVGELYVGGAGVARGYLNRPELDRERFVPDAFAEDAKGLLYRTGDLVRCTPEGVFEFIGRNDEQVKIRGFRIEPGEIEYALARHPAVRACAVLARADRPGDRQLVAYFVAESPAQPPTAAQLREHLAATLPDFMVPARYLRLDALPVTANGKLDRRALPAPDRSRPELADAFEPAHDAAERQICEAFAELLDIDQVGRNDNFFALGGNSLLGMRLLERIRRARGMEAAIPPTLLFREPTPAGLTAALASAGADAIGSARIARGRGTDALSLAEPIAIIAMAGRFPGAGDIEAFWRNLCEGRETISFFASGEIDPGVPADERSDPAYVAARGVVDGVELFDAAFFGISPKEAELMDPQQRVFMELCWECLERAGHVPDKAAGPVGVFAGMYNATYFQRHLAAHPDLIAKLGEFQVMLGNEKDYIATRVAHKLGLTGPAVSVHTACSTSLVAICQAVDSLRAGRCDMALAGGASINCPPRKGYLYQEGSMLSPDGHTRAFDLGAQGTVFSDGAAVVLLKRLSDAIADGDDVFAVLRGVAVNNDGGDKASFTAPSSEGQAAVIAMAHDDAGVEPRSISYVETHGTATPLGDPIEIEGLTKAFRRRTADAGFCRIGSVKTNMGHTVIAAGAAGVIKTALALRERRIPASLHFTAPNPALALDGSPFVVNDRLQAWPDGDGPRRAGVSSFGVGGTNAHVVMEEAPERAASDPAQGPQLLVLSARTPTALARAAANLALHLRADAEANLADVAWTLGAGRKAFAHRIAIVANDAADAAGRLDSPETAAAIARGRPARHGDVAFLFPGQGSQYAGMGRALYAGEPAFRDAFDACADILRGELRYDLRNVVFGDDADALLPTSVMQPAIFAVEYSLARMWMESGLRPVAMAGHSVGEFVAATLAGVFSLADALRLVARRGRLMQAQPPGAMLSVRMAAEAVLQRLPAELSLAAENSPGACVVAGPHAAIAQLQSQLEGEGIACRALNTSHAFHSAMMEAVVAPFRAEVEAVPRSAPRLPIVSTVSGEWLDEATAVSPDYWARHLREPVRFASALGRLLETETPPVLLEVGTRATLAALARQHPVVQQRRAAVVSSLADAPDAEAAGIRLAAGQLWCQGVAIDPSVFDHRGSRRRVRLPTYPFERQRYWIGAAAPGHNVVPLSVVANEPLPEPAMPTPATPTAPPVANRLPRLVAQLKEIFEDGAGFDLSDADEGASFIELGLDSLMLTQVATQLQKHFAAKVTFRQLMGEYGSLDKLAAMLDASLPPESAPAPVVAAPAVHATPVAMPISGFAPVAAPVAANGDLLRSVIEQQMQLMSQQLALLAGTGGGAVVPAPVVASAPPMPSIVQPAAPVAASDAEEEAALAHTKYDVKKAFGAIARIDNSGQLQLSEHQRRRLDAYMQRYIARTRKSKEYTVRHRPRMADPRVVNGFRPLTKEITYQIVVERSKGARMWDLDGNEYVDALNGFGMSLFGWQPDFVVDAVRRQLDLGYDIGPQHPLAGEVAELVCDVTGHDRAALCNTGSEAVLGALRIARTITGRETVVVFNGAYHGIIDEMIVRGTKKLRAVPAAPGILRNTAEHVLVLDYGTPESLQIIRERAHEIAAVLVEPVQSRRPDFRPVEFLRELRKITEESASVLVFDEVVTGFRAHPGGVQALFGIRADLATYGKVVGGGYPIGVIAGKREFMDALDGGQWEYGDDSTPTVGVTYFAGTFVRHPLALAAAKAVLEHVKRQGPQLQEQLNARVDAMVAEMNAFCRDAGAPIEIRHFASVWKTFFLEDHPLQDLLFGMMRSRGVHILDNFPCFLTTAHDEADFRTIVDAFKASVAELQESEFLPRHAATPRTVMDADEPIVPGARLGRDEDGRPAWFVPDADRPGKYLKVAG
ncbi:amino acid adenylation domain-containing protein [Pseudoxanthomonas helianthi]|uniref:amino acid adenylation domain-containing protein n=1 Tax=Pseudoxanthomonas helianthi TaxID=1453541 RepID=UPI00314042D7